MLRQMNLLLPDPAEPLLPFMEAAASWAAWCVAPPSSRESGSGAPERPDRSVARTGRTAAPLRRLPANSQS